MGTGSKKLKDLFRNMKLPEPGIGFTEEVVRETQGIEEDSVYAVARMMDMLKRSSLPTAANEFTYRVLNRMGRHPVGRVDEPVVGWSVWVGIGVFMVMCVAVSLVSEEGESPPGSSALIDIGRYMNSFFLRFRDLVEYLFIVLVSIGLLLRLDILMNKKGTSNRLDSTHS